jgi:hypothetical protein
MYPFYCWTQGYHIKLRIFFEKKAAFQAGMNGPDNRFPPETGAGKLMIHAVRVENQVGVPIPDILLNALF